MQTIEMILGLAYGLTEGIFRTLLRPLLFLFGRGKVKTRAEEVLTLPNAVSLLRIPLGILVWLTAHTMPLLAAMIFGAGVMTDHVDGSLARLTGPTKLGSIIDPICDKFFFFFCAVAYKEKFGALVFWALLGLEIFILLAPPVLLRIKGLKVAETDLRSNIYGKTKFFLECAAIATVVLGYYKTANVALALAIPPAILSITSKIKTVLGTAKREAA